MKLLLDAQLSALIARLLQQRGRDAQAITARADVPDHLDDDGVMELAAREQRAVVTNNIRDFRPIAARWVEEGRTHHGLILVPADVRRTKGDSGAIADALEALCAGNPGGIAGSERWLDASSP